MLNHNSLNKKLSRNTNLWLTIFGTGLFLVSIVFVVTNNMSYEWFVIAFFASVLLTFLLINIAYCRINAATEKQQTQAELFHERELAEATLQAMGEAVITINAELKILYMNPVAVCLTGWELADAIDKPVEQIFYIINEETRDTVSNTVQKCIERNSTILSDEPSILISKNDEEYAIESSSSPICDQNKKIIGAVLIFRNITNIRNLSKKMEFQATHDNLTSLLNRNEFEYQLKIAINTANDEDRKHVICYLDLDQFKIINESCGHFAGDQLLRELSKIMPQAVRSSDCLARLGGDEFGILMFDCPLQRAINIAEQLRQAIKDFTFIRNQRNFEIGASIGLAPITKDCGTLQEILRRADTACYIAKEQGRNRVHVYTPDDVEISNRFGEIQWIERINHALENKQFILSIQDIHPINSKDNFLHREILLRMHNDDGETIQPMSFIPAAERYNLMSSIDQQVVSLSIDMINHENSENNQNIIYNINLSGQTLAEPIALDYIRTEIARLALPHTQLCLEITETAIIANFGIAIEFINDMKTLGCKIALDDFGSGLSSFSYLKKLQVDYIKIDGEFIRDILENPMDKAIVKAINDIAHEMKLETIAEYVETDDVVQLLTDIGINYVQGSAINEPQIWAVNTVLNSNSEDPGHTL